MNHIARMTVAAGGCLLLLASCTVLNSTFGVSDSSTGAEASGSEGTTPSSSGEVSGSSGSDSFSSTTLSSSTDVYETSSTGSSGSSETTDSSSFIGSTGGCGTLLPDGVLAHCTVDCSVIEQDCPDGEACHAWANDGGSVWNATRCSPVNANPGLDGHTCSVEQSAVSGIDSCDVGLMCWNVDAESLEGVCIPYCSGTPDDPMCAGEDFTCSITNDGVLALCLPLCDPLLGNCDEDAVCAPTPGDEFTCVPLDVASCSAGMLDVPAKNVVGCVEGEPCCTPYCDLSEGTACEAGTECTPFFSEPEPAYPNLGVCVSAT